ncbi:hypothetical protein ACWD6P_14050 [Streptomyces sp. NPDC002446]
MNFSGDFRHPFEERSARALQEISDCSALSVSAAQFGKISRSREESDRVFDNLAELDDMPLSSGVRDHYFRFNEIEAYWRSPDRDLELVGEIHLTHLSRSIVENRLHLIWAGESDRERELHKELRFFDDTPRTGSGHMTLLRAEPGTTDPEIWFFDMRQGAMPMDLDYGSYLDTLLITKGTIGWQYLYCETGPGDPGFAPVSRGLSHMLETFPRLFPDYDYSELQARLRERI